MSSMKEFDLKNLEFIL